MHKENYPLTIFMKRLKVLFEFILNKYTSYSWQNISLSQFLNPFVCLKTFEFVLETENEQKKTVLVGDCNVV